jgi:transposase
MVAEATTNLFFTKDLITMKCFPKTEIVTDKFHVQKLVSEAVREERIRLRREVIKLNNSAIQKTRKMEILTNNSSLEAIFYYSN